MTTLTASGTEVAARDRRFLPQAKRYLATVAALIAMSVMLIAMTRDTGPQPDAMPSSLSGFLGVAIAALLGLAASALLANRIWRTMGSRHDAVARGELSDPVTGLLAPFQSAGGKAEAALRVEQAGHIFRQLDVLMAINVINALLLAVAIWREVDQTILIGWLALIVVGAALGIRARMKSRSRPAPTAVSKRALRRMSLHAGMRGLAWGGAFAIFFGSTGVAGKLILLSISLGMLAGGVPALAPVPSAALLFALGIIVPTILRLISIGSGDFAILAMFGMAFTGSLVIVANQLYQNFAASLIARRAQAEQSATISMLLNEFEVSASDWLWETDDTGQLTRLPDRMAGLLAIPKGVSEAPSFDEVLARAGGDGKSAIQACIAGRTPFRDLVISAVDAAGARHWVSLTGSPKPEGGYRGVGSDITAHVVAQDERRQALQRAEQAEQRLKDGIASIGAGFLLADADGRVVMANHGFYEIFSAASVLGGQPTIEALVQSQDRLWQAGATDAGRHWARAVIEQSQGGKPPADIELPSGRWLRVKGATTTEGGTVLLMTDITDIKQQETMLASQARKLAASNNELEQFATVASHDLQEPLRKIEAFGGRLGKRLEGKLDEESTFFLQRMMAATARMRALITDLLSYSRVGRRDGQHRNVDLDRLAADVLDDISVTVTERKATVHVGRLGSMAGDPTQLRQLFQNIVSNALKFVSPGRDPVIEIQRLDGVNGDEQGFELRFKDNGIGFDMQHHDAIFELFQRLHGRDQYEGTGIGLATCRKIVERHGGTLRAESVPGEGTTFIAALPADMAREAAPGTRAA